MNMPSRTRVALFGSFYRGYYVLKELLCGELKDFVTVTGVATDDPSQPFVSPQKRVWQYPHTEREETLVKRVAEREGIAVYNGRVKIPEFYDIFENRWMPDVCIMATFGQIINPRIFRFPRLGFYNLHPCFDDGWPSRYAGGNPFQALLNEGKEYAVIAMHRVDEGIDTGELIAISERIYFPEETNVVDLHKITSPYAAKFAARELKKIIDKAA
jgi:methionyl-tRNA formyltransferase